MEPLEAILERRSARNFTEQHISEEDLRKILSAGMSGPTAVNARDWSFLVVRDKSTLNKMADGNGGPAEPLRKADLGILICGDMERAFERAPDFWIIDAAIAAENMILAAHGLGIGSVWLGTWPVMDKVQRQAELFQLPKHIVPHSIVAFGYPAGPYPEKKPDYEDDRVHFEKW